MTDEQLHELMEAHKHYSAAAEVFKSAHEEIKRLRELSGDAGKLRNERDEARREVCQLMRADDYIEPFDGTVFEYATHRGWDCFKEATDEH